MQSKAVKATNRYLNKADGLKVRGQKAGKASSTTSRGKTLASQKPSSKGKLILMSKVLNNLRTLRAQTSQERRTYLTKPRNNEAAAACKTVMEKIDETIRNLRKS